MVVMVSLAVVFAVIAVLVPALLFILSHHQDSDLTLHLYEHIIGRDPAVALRGKVVWITGASSGIGEYLAYELAGNGCKLVLSARRKEELERVKTKCIAIAKVNDASFDEEKDILVLPLDLMKFGNHEELAAQVISHFAKIDILVNNGGRSQRSFVEDTPLEIEQGLMDLNFVGTISLTKAVLPYMLAKKQGQIAVVSSVMGKWGFPFEAIYCASKFALQGYFDSLRLEVQDKNVNVLLVCPGPVHSNVAKNAITDKPNQSFGETERYSDSGVRMPTNRCARLMAVAMANDLNEVWISEHPALAVTYMSQYTPWLFYRYAKKNFLANMRRMYLGQNE